MIDKEIEHSMLSNTSVKKRKQQINKSKLEHEGASAISQTITETREFSSFRTDVLRRLQSTLVDLVENFDDEFPLTLSSSSSTALGMTSDSLIVDHGTIVGTTIELNEIVENRYSATDGGGGGGGSSAYNVSYASDSETSFTNGSSGRHVCLKTRKSLREVLFLSFRKVLCFLTILIYVQLLRIYQQLNRKR
jgi:hypothetical protein